MPMKYKELHKEGCKNLCDSDETLYSLFISLLPPVDYQYDMRCEVDDCVPSDVQDNKLKLLITVLNALRSKVCLNIPKVL